MRFYLKFNYKQLKEKLKKNFIDSNEKKKKNFPHKCRRDLTKTHIRDAHKTDNEAISARSRLPTAEKPTRKRPVFPHTRKLKLASLKVSGGVALASRFRSRSPASVVRRCLRVEVARAPHSTPSPRPSLRAGAPPAGAPHARGPPAVRCLLFSSGGRRMSRIDRALLHRTQRSPGCSARATRRTPPSQVSPRF